MKLPGVILAFLFTTTLTARAGGGTEICFPVGVGNADGVGTIITCVKVPNEPAGTNPYSGIPSAEGFSGGQWPYGMPRSRGSSYTPSTGWSPSPAVTAPDYSNWSSGAPSEPTIDYSAEINRIQREMESAATRMEQEHQFQQNFDRMQTQISAGPPPPLQITADLGTIAFGIESLKHNFQTQLTESYKKQIKSESKAAQNRETQVANAIAKLAKSIEREGGESATRLQNFKPESLTGTNGLLHAKYVEYSRLQEVLRDVSLKSAADTVEGRQVREVLNRAAVADSEQAAAAAALALGADLAIAEGALDDANLLLRDAGVALDIALGFVPVAGAINDLTQLGFGIITSHDYNGNKMEAIDHALRGAGVVLGLLPAGSALLKLGDIALTPALLNAAEVLRATGLGERLAGMARGSFNVMINAAEAIGALFGSTCVADDVSRTISHLNPATARQGWEGVRELAATLQSVDIERSERIKIIQSFTVGSIEVRTIPAGTSLFRWHNGDDIVRQFGRFASFERIGDPSVARALFALPDQNLMMHLDRFNTVTTVQVFTGTVAPQFGYPGGAVQVFITGPLRKIMEVVP